MIIITFMAVTFYLGGAFRTYQLRRIGDHRSIGGALCNAMAWPALVGEHLATGAWFITRFLTKEETDG